MAPHRKPKDIFEAALVLLSGDTNCDVFVKLHPIFRRIKTYFTEQVVHDSNIYARVDEELNEWKVPASSLLIPITGSVQIGDKTKKVGDVVWPTCFERNS